MKQMRKYQLLFENGAVAELVGFYTGVGRTAGIPIFKIEDKYYLGQNPNTGSVFGAFKRRGYPIFWELSEYPNREEGLKYTGNIVFMFNLMGSGEAKNLILSIIREETKQLIAVNKKHELVNY